jgi:hypothetical protein
MPFLKITRRSKTLTACTLPRGDKGFIDISALYFRELLLFSAISVAAHSQKILRNALRSMRHKWPTHQRQRPAVLAVENKS